MTPERLEELRQKQEARDFACKCDAEFIIKELLDEVEALKKVIGDAVGRAERSFDAFLAPRALKPVVQVLCCIDCCEPLDACFYGAGDGTGQRFRCEPCHKKHEAHKAVLTKVVNERRCRDCGSPSGKRARCPSCHDARWLR